MCVCVCREEFEAHGLSEVVTLECRDVCSDGFNLKDTVDAGKCVHEQPVAHGDQVIHGTVFLDLPSPWLAVEAARLAMKVSHCFTTQDCVVIASLCRSVAADCAPSHLVLSRPREQCNSCTPQGS